MKLACAVSTISRPHDYLHSLLSQIRTAGPVHLVVGNPDRSYVQRYEGNYQYRIVEMTEADWAPFKESKVHHRATFNYWRCLDAGRRHSPDLGLLVMEDDIVPAKGWLARLANTVRQAEDRYAGRYIMALYTAYFLVPYGSALYAIYPTRDFYGTQAIYFPSEVRDGFADFLQERGVEKNQAPYDMLLKDFAVESRTPILATTPSLFQHVGAESTGLGGFHKARNFRSRVSAAGPSPMEPRKKTVKNPIRHGGVVFPDQTFQCDGIRAVHTVFSDAELTSRKEQLDTFIKGLGEATPAQFEKQRGIVICAGGVRYLTCAYVNIQMLRKSGCTLPIEIWHLDFEISKDLQAVFATLGAHCRNVREESGLKLASFQTKPFAILHSAFQETLFLDADNIALRDPSYLFDSPDYKKHGALFWPDYWKTDHRNPIWDLTETVPTACDEFESGQIVIDKARCAREIKLCCFMNQHADFYYQLINGDKDTFKFAWLALKKKYSQIQTPVGQCGFVNPSGKFIGPTMAQHDVAGELLFLHRNLCKWDTTHLDEHIWQELRRFRPDALYREYFLNRDSTLSMVIEGDITKESFRDLYPSFEDECLKNLSELREHPAYARFLIQNYIMFFRQGR